MLRSKILSRLRIKTFHTSILRRQQHTNPSSHNAWSAIFEDNDPIPDHSKYRRITSTDAAKYEHFPRNTKMLVRDFVDNSLYNPYYGYFSKQAQIISTDMEFDFNSMRNNNEFLKILAKKYDEIEEQLEENHVVARQLWHTPVEIFKPWYGYAMAQYMVTEYLLNSYPHQDLIIYELGAGNGSLMLNILDYIRKFQPSVYERTKYKIIEISAKLAEKQANRQRARAARDTHNCVEIVNENIFDWKKYVSEPCFFLAFEVVDNFAHDLIRYDNETEDAWQGLVITDSDGNFHEIYEPINDPLIARYLSLRHQTPYRTPILHKRRFLRKLRSHLPFASNMTMPEFIPTKLLLFLEILKNYFPYHRLLLSDFYTLPDTIEGIDAPVVQTRFERTTVPCSTYMLMPGYFDIFYPTNFELLKDIYQIVCRANQATEDEKHIRILTHKEFLERYADVTRTTTRSRENPMLMFYENVKFFLS